MRGMGNNYNAPPAKRAMTTLRSDPTSNKRQKTSSHLCGDASFRILCHSSLVGGVIGRSGNAIKKLQQQTEALIRFEEAPNDCPDRVISITASRHVAAELSIAQDALLRVFNRVLEVAAVNEPNTTVSGDRLVSCRILADAKHVGAVIGKGGKVVEKIRKDCGVKIRVLATNLPECVGPSEQLIEIHGVVSGVMKALATVSGLLQHQLHGWTSLETFAAKQLSLYPQVRLPEARESQYHLACPLRNQSLCFRQDAFPLLITSDESKKLDRCALENEVIFRILCSKDRVGGISGKNGSIIRAIQNDAEASVSIGPTLNDCEERLITIRTIEKPNGLCSPAQNVVILIFLRTVDGSADKDCSCSMIGSSVSPRLVVSPTQVGSLLGRGGVLVSEMSKATGTCIQILRKAPICVPDADQVVQISGDVSHVQDAIYLITKKLREHFFANSSSNLELRSLYSFSREANSIGVTRDPLEDRTMLDYPKKIQMKFPEPLRDARNELFKDPFRYPITQTIPVSRSGSYRNYLYHGVAHISRSG